MDRKEEGGEKEERRRKKRKEVTWPGRTPEEGAPGTVGLEEVAHHQDIKLTRPVEHLTSSIQ